jgi:hypothetical protein
VTEIPSENMDIMDRITGLSEQISLDGFVGRGTIMDYLNMFATFQQTPTLAPVYDESLIESSTESMDNLLSVLGDIETTMNHTSTQVVDDLPILLALEKLLGRVMQLQEFFKRLKMGVHWKYDVRVPSSLVKIRNIVNNVLVPILETINGGEEDATTSDGTMSKIQEFVDSIDGVLEDFTNGTSVDNGSNLEVPVIRPIPVPSVTKVVPPWIVVLMTLSAMGVVGASIGLKVMTTHRIKLGILLIGMILVLSIGIFLYINTETQIN